MSRQGLERNHGNIWILGNILGYSGEQLLKELLVNTTQLVLSSLVLRNNFTENAKIALQTSIKKVKTQQSRNATVLKVIVKKCQTTLFLVVQSKQEKSEKVESRSFQHDNCWNPSSKGRPSSL